MPDRTVRPYLLGLAALFAAAFLAGALAPSPLRLRVAADFQSLLDPYRDLPGGDVFLLILLNNTLVMLAVLLLGVLLGVLPVLSVGSHGFLAGLLCRQAAGTAGLGKALLLVLPHGIFEIPGLLLAAGYGLWLGAAALRRVRGKEDAELGGRVRHAVRRYFAVVFPLFVLAAAVETALIFM